MENMGADTHAKQKTKETLQSNLIQLQKCSKI
jgi:hypothetical protein